MKYNLTILLAIISLQAFGQKEVYFTDTNVANKKVIPLQGIEVSFIPNKLGNTLKYAFGDYFNISGYIGYFYETPIARTWSMIFTAGIHNVLYNKINYTDSYNYTFEKDYYGIFHIGAEPRWYYSFDKRNEEGKTQLNSGWFLGCPISLEYPFGVLQMHMTPSLGFRHSLTNHLFLEAGAGAGASKYLKILPKELKFDYFVSVKIAYAL